MQPSKLLKGNNKKELKVKALFKDTSNKMKKNKKRSNTTTELTFANFGNYLQLKFEKFNSFIVWNKLLTYKNNQNK